VNVAKKRLDDLLVERELADNKSKARALIMAGEIRVGGGPVSKPGTMVAEDSLLEVARKLPFVSRGGLKLAHALDEFKMDVKGMVAIDAGASTGGFTDCLLKSGAAKVYSVDVGHGQLDYRLQTDPRVKVLDRTNLHYHFDLPEKADLATIDVSFISVTKVIPNVVEHLKEKARVLLLLKPQFEAGRDEVGKGGIIKDPLIHAAVVGRFIKWAIIDNGFSLRGLTASPILGAEGNKEYLILLQLI
jgi:23S rRNA (cytidine1920-2'-O)/16S rRNA (cytidine1409-2'-O)-methyltransferase